MGDLESDQKKIHYINLGLRLALFGLGFVSLVQTKDMSKNKTIVFSRSDLMYLPWKKWLSNHFWNQSKWESALKKKIIPWQEKLRSGDESQPLFLLVWQVFRKKKTEVPYCASAHLTTKKIWTLFGIDIDSYIRTPHRPQQAPTS